MRRGGGGGVAPVLAEPAGREDSGRVNSSGRLRALALLGFLGIFAARAAGPTPEAIAQLPAATARTVDFRLVRHAGCWWVEL